MKEKYYKHKIERQLTGNKVKLTIDGHEVQYDRDSVSGKFSSPLLPYQNFDDLMKLARKVAKTH